MDPKHNLIPKPDSNTLKAAYGISSTGMSKAMDVYSMVDKSDHSIAFVFNEWWKEVAYQKHKILKNAKRIASTNAKNSNVILRYLENCEKYIDEARRYGLNVASRVFGKCTKDEAVSFISKIWRTMSNGTKNLRWICKKLEAVKKILKPLGKLLKKAPGLRYYDVFEKIVLGTRSMFRYDFDKAFEYYLDGLRILVTQIVVDAAVVALVVYGGWVALVLALVIIILTYSIDYFLFNEDPENSKLPTTNLTTKVKPAIEQGFNQFRKIEMPWKNENVWRGPSYYMQEQMI